MKKVLLKIGGMSCSACSIGLEKFLKKQDGISNAVVNLVMNNASIEYDENKLDINKLGILIKKAGFESLGIDDLKLEEKKSKLQSYKLIVISILALIVLYISMAHMIKLPIFSFLDKSINPIIFSSVLGVLTLFIMLACGDILKNGIKNLIHRTPNMDTLVTLGVISSYLYSVYATIMIIIGKIEYVNKLYFESAAVILFFIKIGKYIEGKNKDKTKEALKELMTITPNKATILDNGVEKSVTIDEIKRDDIVICKPGEKIAVDGEIIDGVTHIDESFITGESIPVKREKGSNVIAGSINFDGTIKYKAKKIGKESTISEIVRLVTNATNTKAPIARMADNISSYFVPIIIIIACISFIIWMIVSMDFAVAINRFVTILVVACPCSLGLATPLAIVVASGICSKKGILVKSSEVLENAHKVKTVVFDKTGTLTNGTLSLSKIYNYSNIDEEEILKIVASIENKSLHPIAKALVDYALKKKIKIEEIREFKEIPGYGVKAKYKNEIYLLGNKKLMLENQIKIDNEEDELSLSKDGNSILFVAKESQIIALIGLKDTLKDNVKSVVKSLKNNKVEVVMLTGDNEVTAKLIADEINIDNVIANVKPKEKSEHIKRLKEKGLVMMCGDGINDSVSLVEADIGVSVSNGTDIAINSSDVVLMNDNIEKINDLIYISKRTLKNIKENLFWAFFYNVCMVPIAIGLFEPFGISINPMMASFAMTISSLTVVLNVLRLKRIDTKHKT